MNMQRYETDLVTHASTTPTAAAEVFRAGSVEGPCFDKYRAMSILMRIVIKDPSNVWMNGETTQVSYHPIICSKILSGLFSQERCILEITLQNAYRSRSKEKREVDMMQIGCRD